MFDIFGNILALTIMGLVFFFALLKRSRAAWIFIAGFAYLVLVLHIIPLQVRNNLGCDRFLTAPLAFWVMAFALVRYDQLFHHLNGIFSSFRILSAQHTSWRRMLWLLVACWMLLLSFTTFHTIPVWKDRFQFWAQNHSLYPDDLLIYRHHIGSILLTGRRDLVEKEIRKIQPSLEARRQKTELSLLYARLLMATGDPAVLPFLDEMLDSTRNFHLHEQPGLLESEDESGLRGRLKEAVDFYSLYSEAILFFDKDPERALRLNEIEDWYASTANYNSVKPGIIAHRIAYLYAGEMFEKGDALMKEVQSVPRQYGKVRRQVISILRNYCQISASDACQEPALQDRMK
jgi:hypothetical protein